VSGFISDLARQSLVQAFVNITTKSSTNTPLIVFEIQPLYQNYLVNRRALYLNLRETSMLQFTENFASYNDGEVFMKAVFNYNATVRLSAEYSVILIIFIGILLVLGSVVINNDAETLVIKPIEVRYLDV
jgi:hypothetical protein